MPERERSGRPFTVGLTGGIGSGKSTAAKMFESLGVPVLDLDKVGHGIVAEECEIQAELVDTFGNDIRNADGLIDRRELARRAFASEEATAKINAIMHPAIRSREEGWLMEQMAPYVIIEASVLIESGSAERMDLVVVVLADEAIRRQRVMLRPDAIDSTLFETIIARQCDDGTRLRWADHVMDNNGSMELLQAQVTALHAVLSRQLGS